MNSSQALELHRKSLVVDLHADTAVLLRFGYDVGERHDPPLPGGALGVHLDLPRMREGGLDVQFFGLPSAPKKLPFGWGGPKRTVDRLLDALEAAASQYSDDFELVLNAAEMQSAYDRGKIVGLRGIEGAHALEGDLDNVAHFAQRGVAYLGLLHFTSNDAGAPAYGRGRDDNLGLTPFGRELIDELNRLNVMVDLAHINRKGFMEAAERSTAPVIVSHTGVCGAHQHWRNIDDEQIRVVAESGGCIGVIFSRRYLGDSTLDGVCAHLQHVMNVGGEDLPALGSDFDGFVVPPQGLSDVRGLPDLTQTMSRWGFTEGQIKKMLGENAIRVLTDVRG